MVAIPESIGIFLLMNIGKFLHRKSHVCPNRSSQRKPTTSTNTAAATNKPTYYNKFAKQLKPKMSNSFELLTGPIETIQKKYEVLSDIV